MPAAAALALVAAPLRADVGLFTSLPILWREEADVSGLLKPASSHWARAVIAELGPIVPLDRISEDDPQIVRLKVMVMAQPRPLASEESVALDRWVRKGGRLLLFADPMLTEDSAFVLGDRRRPQDIVRLDALFRRWGLAMRFDRSQRAGEKFVRLAGGLVPVNLPGHLLSRSNACRILSQGIEARCRIGRGELRVIADAALLERGEGSGGQLRVTALRRLLGWLRPASGKSGKFPEKLPGSLSKSI